MIAQQTWLFLYTVLFGILFAVVYDTLRAVRRAVPHALFIIQLEDVVFRLGGQGLQLEQTYATECHKKE